MIKKNKLCLLFITMVLIQWFVPLKLVSDNHQILNYGNEYKFKTAPIDPVDIFRGKYIRLSYNIETIKVQDVSVYQHGDIIYLTIVKDASGYASVRRISTEVPSGDCDYVKGTVARRFTQKEQLRIDLPFDRFYMNESLALPAERAYREMVRDSKSEAYAIVKVLGGKSLVENVIIDGKPIREVALEFVESKN
ncbi:GDYXXLXY domain-containing protein [Prolixibacteraceae bacterium]|nr:GDYXXLXY domain-containing protein [Prolixibacteraceae bacterium]